MHRYWRVLAFTICMSAALLLSSGLHIAHAQGSQTPPAHILEHLQRTGNVPLIVELPIVGVAATDAGFVITEAQAPAIANAQNALLARLAPFAVENVKQFPYSPAIALTVSDVAALEALYADPDVGAIHLDELASPLLDSSGLVVRSGLAHSIFYRGNGMTVAVLDTGVDRFHPALAGKIVSEACYSTTNAGQGASSVCPGGVSQATGNNAGLNCAANVSGCDHGTHVAGIVAGVAPAANIIAIQVFSRFTDSPGNTPCANSGRTSPCVKAFTSDVISGLNQVFTLRNSFTIASVNMSLGGGQFFNTCDSEARKPIIDTLRSINIPTVIAAGNSSYLNAMAAPACISTAISVGATTDGDQVASFSNVNAFTTLHAPGFDIVAAVPGTGTLPKNGTSMAAPHVAGAIAVLRQAKSTVTVSEMVSTFVNNGPPVTDQRPGGTITKRRLDVYLALCALITCDADDFRFMALNSPVNGTTSSAADRDHYFISSAAGNRLTIQLNRLTGSMDPYLELYDPLGNLIAVNNNGGTGTNALINNFFLPITGRYQIVTRSVNNSTGTYQLSLSSVPVQLNPVPSITRLSPTSATGTFFGNDFWVAIYGNNFMPTSSVYWNGSLRTPFYSNSQLIYLRARGSDLGTPWPRNVLITVSNPQPGGGTSSPYPFPITFPFLGTSELLQPSSGATVTTGISTTFVVSWTTPITPTLPFTTATWRSMQNMDLRLRDDTGRVAAWIRVTEGVTETSTMRLLTAAESIQGADAITVPLQGIPGVDDFDIVITDTVTLHLGASSFRGSGLTAIMSPTVTFGPLAVGTYNVEFRVDGPNGEVQDDDVLGVIHIVPASCPAAVVELDATGPATANTGVDTLYSATLSPVDATGPVTITWAPEPVSGQGTLNATYRFDATGTQNIFVSAENCGGFAADVIQTAVARTSGVDLEIVKSGPASALAGDAISYTLTITNHGTTTATNLSVVDTLPPGATYVAGGATVGNAITFVVPTLSGYGTATSVAFSVNASTTITNSVYGVNADGGASATGTISVVTTIPDAQVTVGPTLTGTLIYSGSDAGLQVQAVHALASVSITFPAGTVFDETTLTFTAHTAPELSPPTGKSAVATFALAGSQNGQPLPTGQVLSEIVPMQMHYTDAAISGLEEASLQLYVLDGATWSSTDIACAVNAAANRLDCTLGIPLLSDYLVVGTEIEEEPEPEPEPEPDDIHLFIPAIRK